MFRYAVTISICFHNRVDVSQKCLHLLRAHTPRNGIEYIFSDNGSTDETPKVLANCGLPNVTIVTYPENLGFQTPHNEALKIARGEFFIVMNNDIYLEENDWLMKVLEPLRADPNVAIVGLVGTPDTLSDDGSGYAGGREEYVEGSLLAGRTEEFLKYGLFSPAFRKYYFEDSDLSLRFRQMGRKIAHVRIKHKHVRSATADFVGRSIIMEAQAYNGAIWKKRWDSYVRNRTLNNTVLIKANSAGIGDVLAVTPVLKSLRKDHPTAKFTVETTCPDIFLNNPFVDDIVSSKGTATSYSTVFDRVVDLMPPPHEGRGFRFASYSPFCVEAAREAGTHLNLEDALPLLYLTRKELDYGAQIVKETAELAGCDPKLVVGLSAFSSRTTWEGRTWVKTENEKLVARLVDDGFGVLEIGKHIPSTTISTLSMVNRTTLREYFAIIANLPQFVTVDTLSLWAAQAFGVPTICLFGATEPIAKVLDFGRVFVVRNEGLSCLGCYQRKGDPGYNRCEYGHEACMHGIRAEKVYRYLIGEENGVSANLSYLSGKLRSYL